MPGIMNAKCAFWAVLSLSLLLLSSCEVVSNLTDVSVKAPSQPQETYTIRKNEHNSANKIRKLATSTLRFEAVFDSSAVYETVDPANQADINKLYGLSDCGSLHQQNSARFGWRWYNNRLEIHAYTYNNSTRKSVFIAAVELGKPFVYELALKDGSYVFTVDEKQVSVPRACSGLMDSYQLYPYFGGDEAAPHEIKIRIKELP
ncbi:hypothetical protein [Pontibacter beigongshangensis]|uniref:hypothetical protein n=1 Tax=Pontibacter beigongshangensis TaxID=2574733 RepID=UPI001F51082A|nr:hypothetical protein [Pontibacter beigongshangensis]